jgi:hypothetical protein
MRNGFRNLIAIIALVAVVYIVSNYTGVIQQQVGVKGIRTDRAQDISSNISSDIGREIDAAQQKALQVNLGDVMHWVSRFQKIPRDINATKAYLQEQYDAMVKSDHKKAK